MRTLGIVLAAVLALGLPATPASAAARQEIRPYDVASVGHPCDPRMPDGEEGSGAFGQTCVRLDPAETEVSRIRIQDAGGRLVSGFWTLTGPPNGRAPGRPLSGGPICGSTTEPIAIPQGAAYLQLAVRVSDPIGAEYAPDGGPCFLHPNITLDGRFVVDLA